MGLMGVVRKVTSIRSFFVLDSEVDQIKHFISRGVSLC